MAQQKYNARDVDFQIEDFLSPGTWITIEEINTFSKSHEEETADTTVFTSQGQAESQKMQIAKSMTIEGFRKRDNVTGAIAPGQAKVEALSERLGEESLGRFRFSHKNDTTWSVWTAHVNLGDQGGGNNDKVGWAATFTRSGAETTVAKP
ncbi:phage tail tube protein [Streptomyces sp. NPDC058335]|uniref:phage tail tube protein n=1 Tax=Streptomyces sp. NPDC058335 TaxID=3346451 RepID=UPI003669FCEB